MAVDYFTNEQLQALAYRLLKLTDTGSLDWRPFGQTDYAFFVRIRSSIFVIESRDEDDLAPHVLRIYAVQEDAAEPRQLQEADSQYLPPTIAELFAELYQLVKRQTLKIDVMAKNILAELDDFARDQEPPF